MTRSDYEAFAAEMRVLPRTVKRETVAKMLADVFERDNANFNRERFLEACELEEEAR